MQYSLYHSLLRVASSTLALILLFDSGFILPVTKELSQNTQLYLGNVIGVSAGVESTELSLITAELKKKEQELNIREQEVKEREIKLNTNPLRNQDSNISTFVLSVILFILLTLIVLNYGLDFARVQRNRVQYAKTN